MAHLAKCNTMQSGVDVEFKASMRAWTETEVVMRDVEDLEALIAQLDKDIEREKAVLEDLAYQRAEILMTAARVSVLHKPPYVRNVLENGGMRQ